MLLDNRKGVETRTRQLFRVCKKRRLPIFTLVNKCDRAGADPFGLLDDVENDLGIRCYAATWPVWKREKLIGVCDRMDRTVHLYEKATDHGQTRPTVRSFGYEDSELEEVLEPGTLSRLRDEVGLLDVAGGELDLDSVRSGDTTLVFFGSALTSFGIDILLSRFLSLAPPPVPRESTDGLIDPVNTPFSGFVFKVQANMDPRHRDRIAFLRICSGRFTAGDEAVIARTGKSLRLAEPQEFMASERSVADAAVAGDVVGLHDRGTLRVGDSIAVGRAIQFPGVPRFSPEQFVSVNIENPMRRKHLDQGLRHLAEEGTILLLFSESVTGPIPIVGAVGRLQFDVLADRLDREYGVQARLSPLSYACARWVSGPDADIDRVSKEYGRRRVEDADGLPMILFDSEWVLEKTIREEKDLTFHEIQPAKS